MLAKGTVKYDDINNLDFHRSRRITVENANVAHSRRNPDLGDESLLRRRGRDAANVPPAAQFQASLQILNNDGVRIRERTEIAAPANEVRPVGERANNEEATRGLAAISGAWRIPGWQLPGGLFQVGRADEDVAGGGGARRYGDQFGMSIPGHLVIVGPREGQFIDPMTDRAVFLFDASPADRLHFVAIGAPRPAGPK